MLRLVAFALMASLATAGQAEISGRIKVVDGDTLRVAGTPVRLHGIDAPEVDQTCTRPGTGRWPCGNWVKDEVTRAFNGKHARCKILERDRFGRSVSRCFVDDVDIGATLVQAGLAFAYRRYSMDYDLDEKRAAVQGLGLHGFEVQQPSDYRKAKSAAKGRIAPDPACAIKGNISASGRIFHTPGQRDYEATGINTARGERWFCSAAEARAAGWRAAKR